MNIEQNKRIARRLVEALGTSDDPSAFDVLHEDAIWTVMAHRDSFPVAGDLSKAGFIEHMNRFHSSLLHGIQITVGGLTAEGDRVAVEAKSRAVLANGNTLEQVYHFLFEIKDGRIVAVREYIDTAHALAAFNG